MLKKLQVFSYVVLCLSLNGCAELTTLSEKYSPQKTVKNAPIATQWQATLPHDGKQTNLAQFWQQFDDALLVELIDAVQAESADIASAKARIAQARSARTQANATLLPTVDGSASLSRAVQQPASSFNTGIAGQGNQSSGGQPINTSRADIQASWELEIFGVNHSAFVASQAQENAAKAGWHSARISVAAELANTYFDQRFCTLQLGILQSDVQSRAESLRLIDIAVNAGFSAPMNRDLARASLADARQQLQAQQMQCDLDVKALVALTNSDEPTLREKLNRQAFTPQLDASSSLFSLDAIPANIIAQRPDINAAEADLITANADIQNTYASSLPKISLNGSIGWMNLSSSGFSSNGSIWSLGPISLTMPIFHPGVQEAGLASSEAQYEEKASVYRSKVRNAVKEVEEALVSLHSANLRQTDIETSIKSYQASFEAIQVKVNAGFANLIELEEQRRIFLAAQTNALNNQKQRLLAWVSLYRAAGGGWDKTEFSDTGNTK